MSKIHVGNFGRDVSALQKNSPIAGNDARMDAPEATSCGPCANASSFATRPALGPRMNVCGGTAESLRPDAKAIATLAAKFALAGHELRVVRKDNRAYYEVRRWGQCYACSTEADLLGLLRQLKAAAE